MPRWLLICLISLGIVVGLPFVGFLAFWAWISWDTYPSNIVGFKPTTYAERTESPFFYSIGSTLMYSNSIDPQARPIVEGQITRVLIAPDAKHAAVVVGSQLIVVSGDGSLNRKVAAVSSIYREPKPVGEQFVRDDGFQWSSDSKLLYYIRDEYYASKGSQLFSQKGELWVFNIATSQPKQVISPFRAHKYFLGVGDIYFSEPDEKGNLVPKHFDGNKTQVLGVASDGKASADPESLFYTFTLHDYERGMLRDKQVRLERKEDGTQRLLLNGRETLSVTRGKGIKGPYHCQNGLLRSAFLPGDRYFLTNVHCGNYEGQLLIDASTGIYKVLPKDTRVYPLMNTRTFPKYRITSSGIEV